MSILDYIEQLWHAFNDIITFFGWFFYNLINFFKNLFVSVQYVFTFLKSFSDRAFSSPVAPESIWQFPSGVLSVFHSIPYWTTISQVLAVSLFVIFTIFILNKFLHI